MGMEYDIDKRRLPVASGRTRFPKLNLIVILGFIIIIISGCGGGSSSGGSEDGTTPEDETNAITISGAATKGPISGATATAFALDADGNKGSQLGTATTASEGSFSIDIGNYQGNVLVEVSGGNYIDEASNTNVSNTATLRVALTNVTENISTQATPLTEIAVQIAEKKGGITQDRVRSATSLVSNLIGGADITSTPPANVLDSTAETASGAEQVYGLLLAAISQLIQDGKAVDVTAAIAAIANDLADDETLNDTGDNLSAALTNFTLPGGYNNAGDQNVKQLNALIAASMIPGAAFSMDDLAGTWNWGGFATPAKESMSNDYFADFGYTIQESDGSYESHCVFDSGDPCGAPQSGSGFTITANGFIPALNLEPGEGEYGFMSASKNLVATLHIVPGEWQRFSVALKRASSYSWADLEGSWMHLTLSSLTQGASTKGHSIGIGITDINSDGSGTETCIVDSSDGCDAIPPMFSAMDEIGDDGWFSPPLPAGDAGFDWVSADKNIMAGVSKNVGGRLNTEILVRKADSYSMAELAGTWVRLAFKTPLDTNNDAIESGDYGFDVGTLNLNADGTYTYTCIDTSDSDGCTTSSGTINGIGNCNITYPASPGESECGVVSAGKDIAVTMMVNGDTDEQELAILLKRGDLNPPVGTTYNFADYFLQDAQVGCSATYEYTDAPNTGNQFTNEIVDTYDVNFGSGPVSGIEIESRDQADNLLDTYIVSKDATTVQFLGYNDYYIAKDCDMSAPSPRWSFSTLYDGMIIDQTGIQAQINRANLSECVPEFNNQKLLFRVQDLSVRSVDYPNAIVMYYLDTDYPFHAATVPQRVIDYGITLPNAVDTSGSSITAYDIYADNAGQIAGGNVDAETGTFFDPYELVSSTCP